MRAATETKNARVNEDMASGMSGCVDLVSYDPEVLDPDTFKVNSALPTGIFKNNGFPSLRMLKKC